MRKRYDISVIRLSRDYPNQLQTALIYNDFLHYTLRLLPIYCFLEFRYEINNQKQSCREAPAGLFFYLSAILSISRYAFPDSRTGRRLPALPDVYAPGHWGADRPESMFH